ncbi:MAG TPA: bifunctional UDP-sugar hydrolase/5'-nucleotidase [Polyangiaceae bacterium]
MVGLNDLHGRLEALPVMAGYVERLKQVRQTEGGGVLFVDAGDMLQGTLESNLNEGRAIIATYNMMGLDAATLGNHEFDFGPAGDAAGPDVDPQGAIRERIGEAGFPLLSANLVERATRRRGAFENLFASALVDVAGVAIGLVGVLTAETPQIVMPAFFKGLDVAPLAPAITREARWLRERGARAVVVVAHAGAVCESWDDPDDVSSCRRAEIFDVVRELEPGLVDLVVAGHTHAVVAHRVNGVAIVEARSHGEAFSRADLRFDARAGVQVRIFPPEPLCPRTSSEPCHPHDYEGGSVVSHDDVRLAIEPALTEAAVRREALLGVEARREVAPALKHESALGNLFTDLMLDAVPGADVALTNGGGLRAALPQGPLRYRHLFEAIPFDNYLSVVELTGEELERVLSGHLASERHGIVSVSGLYVVARCKRVASGASELDVALHRKSGARVKHGERLVLVTSNYLATGGDGVFDPIGLEPSRIRETPRLVRDALESGLKARKVIDGKSLGLFDPKHPRLILPSARPVTCTNRTAE